MEENVINLQVCDYSFEIKRNETIITYEGKTIDGQALLKDLLSNKNKYEKCLELKNEFANKRVEISKSIEKYIDMPQVHLTAYDKRVIKSNIRYRTSKLDDEVQSVLLKSVGLDPDYKFNYKFYNILNNFVEGYSWVFNTIRDRINEIERENHLENIVVGDEGLEEFLESEIYGRNRYSPDGEYRDFISQLIKIILEDEEMTKVIESNRYYNQSEYYCDELLQYLSFYPRLTDSDRRNHHEHVVRPIETVLDKYIGFDSVAVHMFPPSGPANTIYGELLNECRRLQYRWNNDGDTGWDPTDCIFSDHVNVIELIRRLDESDFRRLLRSIEYIEKFIADSNEVRGFPSYFIGGDVETYEKYEFSMDLFDDMVCATGAYIIYAALVHIAEEEFPDTPPDQIDYRKVKFLNQENTYDCRHGVIWSDFIPRKSYYGW